MKQHDYLFFSFPSQVHFPFITAFPVELQDFKKNVYFFLKLTCLSVKYVWFWQGCEKCVDIAGWGEAGAEGTVTAYILWFPIYLCGEKWEKRDVRKRLSARKQADKEVTVAYWGVILEVLREMNQFDSKSPPLVA